MSVKVKIDGVEYEANEGELLIDLAARNGIDIPHFCYHPGLGPDGNCRMCQVEFLSDRGNRLGISCKAVVMDGMDVSTKSEAALRARASVEEFLLLNHPLDCPICDKAGECTLQNYYMEHDLEDSRQNFTRFKKDKAVDIGPPMVLDQERCVLCDRCVRFLRDVAGDEQLFIAGRGHSAYITPFPGKEVDSAYSLNTVDICPVGALTAKDFRFASPTWYLRNTNTVCTTCSRGCSMQLQVHRNFTDKAGEHRDRIMRFRPRHNPDVNKYWACDEGRLNYKFVNQNRVDNALVRRGDDVYPGSLEEAIAETRSLLGFEGAGKVANPAANATIVVSASASLEEMFLAGRLAELLGSKAVAARHCADGVDDNVLRRADRHANAAGAKLLGMDVVDLRADAGAVATDGVLIAIGFNNEISRGLLDAAAKAKRVVAITGCETELSVRADVVIPGVTWAEKDGLVVNFEGHLQRLRAGVRPRGVSDWEVLDTLIASIQGTEPVKMIGHVRKAMQESVDVLAEVNVVNVGAAGVRLSGQPVG
jgi:NADH-quinone oxidoreductase subunit G